MDKYKFLVKKTTDMSQNEFSKCARLFSVSYGKYSKESNRKPGEQITMSEKFFENHYKKENVYIATCSHAVNGALIGQAIYIRKKYADIGNMTWVMQLVVNSNYRNKGIGSKLLHSIWGFSDDFAWGLATANPCTVKALERATFRKCDPSIIQKNLKYIKRLADDIEFVKENKYKVNEKCSQAYTDFYIDNSEFAQNLDEKNWKLGKLIPGYEWLAFTFRNQECDKTIFKKYFGEMIKFSEEKLKDAYGRMKMNNHSWASYEANEIDEILSQVDIPKRGLVLDVGCGRGRHSIELAKRGYSVDGIDFSSRNIKGANSKIRGKSFKGVCHFLRCDAKGYSAKETYDFALCLYDVIGSYPNEEDNIKILNQIYNNLKYGSFVVISVMNREYLESRIDKSKLINVHKDYDSLYELKPSKIMQTTGDVFDLDYMVMDSNTGIVYRKEQFDEDENLPAEYLIRDKRYNKKEIEMTVKSVGFNIVETRFVRAGKFEKGQKSKDCKEILIIAKK